MTLTPISNTVTMPALALRGLTIFPNMMLHFDVGRDASIKALDEAMTSGQPIFLVSQKNLAVEAPGEEDLYTVGTISSVRQILRMPGNMVRVMVEGEKRGWLRSLTQKEPYLADEVEEILEEKKPGNTPKTEALIRQVYECFQQYAELAEKVTPDIFMNVLANEEPGYIADFIAQNIVMRTGDKQEILEELRRLYIGRR